MLFRGALHIECDMNWNALTLLLATLIEWIGWRAQATTCIKKMGCVEKTPAMQQRKHAIGECLNLTTGVLSPVHELARDRHGLARTGKCGPRCGVGLSFPQKRCMATGVSPIFFGHTLRSFLRRRHRSSKCSQSDHQCDQKKSVL